MLALQLSQESEKILVSLKKRLHRAAAARRRLQALLRKQTTSRMQIVYIVLCALFLDQKCLDLTKVRVFKHACVK